MTPIELRAWAESLTRAKRQEYEERAGIMEYEGGMGRARAEDVARRDCILAWGARLGGSAG